MLLSNKPTLIFDVESGGLSGHRSSILSISYRRHFDKRTYGREGLTRAESLYANPVEGRWISKWSEENVWKPIRDLTKRKGIKLQSEEQVLTNFLNILKKTESGTTLAGWNIGYQARPQGSAFGGGFDIPMIMTRAGRYGMQEQFRQQFSKFNIRDIGQEYALKMARAVHARPDLVEKGLYGQIESYMKVASITQAQTGWSDPQLARYMSKEGYRVSGWKQELLHNLLYPGKGEQSHLSDVDIKQAARMAFGDQVIGPEHIAEWNKQALQNKLLSSARYPPRPGQLAAGRFEGLLQTARFPVSETGAQLPSVEKGFMKNLENLSIAMGGDLDQAKRGLGLGIESQRIWESKQAYKLGFLKGQNVRQFAGEILEIGARNKGKFAIGAAITAAYALQVGNLFSGKDDAYNTIEGLPHGGFAEQMRRSLTDFGSGYQGLPKQLMGQKIDPRILKMREETLDVPEEKKKLEADLKERQAEALARLGTFDEGDFHQTNLSFIEGMNSRDKSLRSIRLDRFNLEVEDADTLVLHRKGVTNALANPIQIRLAGIDAPETAGHEGDPLEPVRIWQAQTGGEEASETLKNIISNQDDLSLVISTGQKTYGRYLGAVIGDGGTNLNVELARQGAVTALPFGKAHEDVVSRDVVAAAETEAFESQNGLWRHARYQAIKTANRSIGQAITNNTFTRLDKLGSNLNLGAFASFLESLGDEERNLTQAEIRQSRRMGGALRKTHGRNRFSNKSPKVYGKQEAMSTKGMAADSRPGYGFEPEHSKNLKKIIGMADNYISGVRNKIANSFGSKTMVQDPLLRAAWGAEKAYQELVLTTLSSNKKFTGMGVGFHTTIQRHPSFVSMDMQVHSAKGERLFRLERSFAKNKIGIDFTGVDPRFQGQGLGKALSLGEHKAARQLGYEYGSTTIQTNAVNPVTARWGLKFGGKLTRDASEDVVQNILNKQVKIAPGSVNLKLEIPFRSPLGYLGENIKFNVKQMLNKVRQKIPKVYEKQEAMSVKGMAADSRPGYGFEPGHSKNLKKIIQNGIELFRGSATKTKITDRLGQQGLHVLKKSKSNQYGFVEEAFERIRKSEFSHRPSRLTSSFWSPDKQVAAEYAGKEGFVKSVHAENPFITSMEYYNQAVSESVELSMFFKMREMGIKGGPVPNVTAIRKRVEEQAKQYWAGVPESDWGLHEGSLEALLPGKITATAVNPIPKVYGKQEAMPATGAAAASRPGYGFEPGHSKNLKKIIKMADEAMNLFRGSQSARRLHSPVFGAGVKNKPQEVIEQVLERVRTAQFSHRPARADVTYWSPNPEVAAKYAGPMGQGGHVGSIKAPEETFFTREDIVTDMIKAVQGKDSKKKEFLLSKAQEYWKGVDPNALKGTEAYKHVEALVPGEQTVERLWSLQRSRRGHLWKNVQRKERIPGLPEEGSFAQKLNKLNTDFGSPVDLLKAVGRAETLYKDLLSKSLSKSGIVDAKFVSKIIEKDGQVILRMKARGGGGAGSFGRVSLERRFSAKGIELQSLDVSKGMQGSGIGKEIYQGEVDIFQQVGYKAGEEITSPVVSAITGRWQMQMYNSKITSAAGGIATSSKWSEIERQMMNKEIAGPLSPVYMTGRIPGPDRIPGLAQEGSMAQKLNKINTDFGSPVDLAKAVAGASIFYSGRNRSSLNRFHNYHKDGIVRASRMASKGGRGHGQQTGRIVV